MYSANYPRPEKGRTIGEPWIAMINHIQAAVEPDWSFHMHAHEDTMEVSYVLGGRGALYCDGRFYEIREGDIIEAYKMEEIETSIAEANKEAEARHAAEDNKA